MRQRIDRLREFFDHDTEEARKILDAVLDGPRVFNLIDTPEGKRYEVTGRVATGEVLRVLSEPHGGPPGEACDPYPLLVQSHGHLTATKSTRLPTARLASPITRYWTLWPAEPRARQYARDRSVAVVAPA